MSSTRTMPLDMDFSTLIHLANTPGPMQGMAQAYLQQISDQSSELDARSQAPGPRAMPANGPAGLNFGDPTAGHANYPAALAEALINRYGQVARAPTGVESSTLDIEPAPEALQKYNDEMDRLMPPPSLWEKIKAIGGAIAYNPRLATEPLADMAAYATPMIGNSKGVEDLQRDWAEMEHMGHATNNGLETAMRYGPSIAMDMLQSVLPLGWRGATARSGSGLADVLARYSTRAPDMRSILQGMRQ